MRCIESCTYQEMPNNVTRLKNHIEHCEKCVPANQINIVWNDGEFVAVREIPEEVIEVPVDLEVYEEPDIPEPVESVAPAFTTMSPPRKRKAKMGEDSDEL